MNEKERMGKQFLTHTIYIIISFIIILLTAGSFIFLMVRGITYSTVDKALVETANEFVELSNRFSSTEINLQFNNFYTNTENELSQSLEKELKKYIDATFIEKANNLKQIIFIRNQDGQILDIDSNVNKEYAQYLAFDSNSLEKVYLLSINNQYFYRGLNIKVYSGNEIRYVQILQNIDTENELVSHYFEIIVTTVFAGIIMSTIASYILSKITLSPISDTLKKQMEFVQDASHELRTPLTIIQSKQELLLQDPNAKIIDRSDDIILTLNEAKRLTKLTNDLMILARADDNRIKMEKERTDIDLLISNMIEPYIDIAKLENKQLLVNLNYKQEINIDKNKISQVIVILLDNALKYTEEGDSIELNTFSKDGKCVIQVKDTGIGISDEAIKHIFDRFYREDKSRTRETGGSGLGLSIADALVRAHGGTIRVAHNSPKGTVFTIKM